MLIFLCIVVLTLESSACQANASPPPTHAIDQDVLKGIESLYNSEFDTAEELFREVTLRFPKDPKGYFYLAMVTWSRLTYGFWTGEVVEEYSRRIDKTIRVAREKIARNEADCFTYFYLGGALGFKGRFKLMQRKWASSLFLALDAVEALKTCKSLDPDNQDVLLGLGIFDYYTSRLSGLIKFFSYLLITREGKEEGLRKLHAAADSAAYSAAEAKSVLLHIYLFMENDYANALSPARELALRFPNNHRYKYLEGLTYLKLNMDLEYDRVLEDFQRMSRGAFSRATAALWANQVPYLEASRNLFRGRFSEARDKLRGIIEKTDPSSDPAMAAWPLLKIGMSYDVEGERERALKYYAQIMAMENGAGAQFLAEKYTQEAASDGDPFLGY